jgi:hypothetical protein
MANNKIRLSRDDLRLLLIDGKVECSFEGALLVGSTYSVSGTSILVLVRSAYQGEDGKTYVVFEENMGGCTNAPRIRNSELRKVTILSRRDEGAFIGKKSKFQVGEEVAASENYQCVYNRIKRERGVKDAEKYRKRVAEVERVDVLRTNALAGWCNAKYVKPELMPRRVEILGCERINARDICDEDWHLMGVDWIRDGYALPCKRQYVGEENWDANKEVIVYRYKTLEGSVQTERDLMSYKDLVTISDSVYKDKEK